MLGRRLLTTVGMATLLALSSCISPGEGPDPPPDSLYFPVAASVSPGGHTLYVANSDFDLQFNGGTVLALDLDRVRAMLPPIWDPSNPAFPCAGLGDNTDRMLYPGRCGPMDLNAPPDGLGSLVGASVQIGAFASDMIVVPRNDGPGARMFLPVRGDPSITWIDLDDDRYLAGGAPNRFVACGQSADSPRCSETHRAGIDPATNLRGAMLPPEPYSLAASEAGDAIVVSHQTSGSMSLITNPWDGIPALQFVGGGFPYGAVGVAALPVPEFVRVTHAPYQPGFLATFRSAPEVDLIRYFDDSAAAPMRPFITRAGASAITVNASGYDSRGIALDPSARKACETACLAESECLRACANVPVAVYIANRAPPSLLVGETRANVSLTGSDDLITIFDTVPLGYGPSIVRVGSIINRDGVSEPRVLVSCFDSRYLFIYDPAGHRVDGQVRTGRGPHGLVMDPNNPLLYVVHFTDSYIGVIDLDQRHAGTYATLITTLGTPVPPRESK